MDKVLQRYNDLYISSNKHPDNIDILMEMDSIVHLMGCNLNDYKQIVSFCCENNYNHVIDIGCAYAHQSELFIKQNIKYTGIDSVINKEEVFNKDLIQYQQGEYPCDIRFNYNKKDTLGVSVLCLFWNCYLFQENTIQLQIEGLKKDFKQVLLRLPNAMIDIKNFFGSYKIIEKGGIGSLVLFY